MLLMLFTKSIDRIASVIFVSTMAAGALLIVRAACYMYLFYIKQNHRIGLIDWLFATVHGQEELFLVPHVQRQQAYVRFE